MLQRSEAGTRPFVCTPHVHIVRKFLHTERISAHFYVVAGTVCKRSAYDATLKTEVILSLLHDAQIQTS